MNRNKRQSSDKEGETSIVKQYQVLDSFSRLQYIGSHNNQGSQFSKDAGLSPDNNTVYKTVGDMYTSYAFFVDFLKIFFETIDLPFSTIRFQILVKAQQLKKDRK